MCGTTTLPHLFVAAGRLLPKNARMGAPQPPAEGVPRRAPRAPVGGDAAGGTLVLHRERLHALLDARLPGAVWLHGPTGAGKTVLLRTYLQRDRTPTVWVTVDERHRDPAALFASVGAAAASLGIGSLPSFSPEHRDDPAGFGVDFFARLDDMLPPDGALVVDDVHHLVGTTAPLLAAAIDAFAGRRTLCFASQLLPDAAFAPQLARSRLWTVGHRLLAFDDEEARALAVRLGGEPSSLHPLVDATDGWAAGLMLAMQLGAGQGPDDGTTDPLASVRTPLALLIAGQVLGGVDAADVDRLRVLAELPVVPIDLGDVAPDWSGACARLQALAERGLFVERLTAERVRADAVESVPKVTRLPKGCWRLHELFRSALRKSRPMDVADSSLTADLVGHLVGCGRLDLGWHLATRAGPGLLLPLVRTQGSVVLAHDQLPQLLPMTSPHANRDAPMLALWMARALIGQDPEEALRRCDEAYHGFDAADDQDGRTLAVALAFFVVFSTMENVGAIASWRERFERLGEASPLAADREHEAILVAGAVVRALLIGTVDADAAASAQDRLLQLVAGETLPANETLLAGSLLVAAMRRSLRIDEVGFAIVRVDGLPSGHRAAPHLRATWKSESGFHFARVGEYERARACFDEAIRIAEANALSHSRYVAEIGLARLELGLGAVDRARTSIARLEAAGSERLGRHQGLVVHLQARAEALRGHLRPAIALLDVAERLLADAGFPASAGALIDQDRMQLLYGLGDVAGSTAFAATAMARSNGADAKRLEQMRTLLEAHAVRVDDRPRCVALLAERLPTARAQRSLSLLPLLPQVVADLCAEALRDDVCTDFVAQLIRARRLGAPRHAPAAWPWPVRIEVLRPFRIHLDGTPLVFTGKTQQKPLELLKYLACTRELVGEVLAVAGALWPDHDDAAARKNLEVTVSRLRKILGDDTLVIVKDGKVALDATRVTSDARELGDAIRDAETAASARVPKGQVDALGSQLLALFTALPLEDEESTAWREAVRERVRSGFVRAARTIATYWVDVGEPDRAIGLVEAALVREPLAENLYRALMQIHIDRGHGTEAMRLYRQCRQMLSILIGAQPSAETEHLKNSIVL